MVNIIQIYRVLYRNINIQPLFKNKQNLGLYTSNRVLYRVISIDVIVNKIIDLEISKVYLCRRRVTIFKSEIDP